MWLQRVLVAGAAVVLLSGLSGCGAPTGVDGNLLDDWPGHTAAKIHLPVVGECWTAFGGPPADDVLDAAMTSMACTEPHTSETIFVDTLTGLAAQSPTVPRGVDLKDAYGRCDRAAADFLGGDWHDARVALLAIPPTAAQWRGGARHFRCDLIEVKSDAGRTVLRTGTLKDALRGARPLALGCQLVIGPDNGSWSDFDNVACTVTHGAEYAGSVRVSDRPYPKGAALDAAVLDDCIKVVADFLGLTVAQYDARPEIEAGYWAVLQDRWEFGDRSARCYVMLAQGRTVTRSLKGLGTAKI